VTLFFASFVTGCAPAIYASGHSAADLPKRRDAVVLEGFSAGSTKDPNPPTPSDEEAHQIEVAREQMVPLFKANDISLLDDPAKCLDCLRLKVFVHLLPWNPLIGGNITIFMRADAASGGELFSTLGIRIAHLADLAIGYDHLTRDAVDQAGEKFITELHGTATLPGKAADAGLDAGRAGAMK
jgi:hypothetical protein